MCYLFIILLTNADTEKKKKPKEKQSKVNATLEKNCFFFLERELQLFS